ncbi:hypothetical protein MTR67_019399 [Solanum verrucosum]|uniref:Uncharacterized protein n=1 Tax=Solanum verrucosum TaxID=315347 RepID=A0AAF0QU81_SOLVR|nr:hypothetical protein MTR67_019399 [Solanum verrucosum]
MPNRLKRRNLKGELGRKRGLEMMMVILLIKDLMGMVILSIDKGFPGKIPPMLLSIVKIGCLTLNSKELVVNPYGLLVVDVERDMRVGVWTEWKVVLVVVKVATRLRIVHKCRLRGERVSKLLLVVRMGMLQRKIGFMLSKL